MAYPPVVVVDTNDKVVGWSPLAEAWQKSLIHRVVYVLVADNQGRVLLQQRAASMRLYPNCWDVAGGHVDVTPDYEESAKIELREEAGIEDVPLKEVAYFYSDLPYHNGTLPKRFIKIYWTKHTGALGKTDDEVTATRWFTPDELRQLQREHPERIAVGLEICFPYILKGYEDHQHQAASQTDRPLFHIR